MARLWYLMSMQLLFSMCRPVAAAYSLFRDSQEIIQRVELLKVAGTLEVMTPAKRELAPTSNVDGRASVAGGDVQQGQITGVDIGRLFELIQARKSTAG